MSTTCRTCAEPELCDADLDKYSLQDDNYLFVANCPPGTYCGANNFLFLVCCDGNTLRVDFVAGMSQAKRDKLIADAVAECERRREFCDPGTDNPGNPPNVPPDPNTPYQYYYSGAASCVAFCPDGLPFTYTIPAGLFLAKSKAEADAKAHAYACSQAAANRFCLSPIPECACKGSAYSATITGSPARPMLYSVTSGSLPPGLSFARTTSMAIVHGIPTTAGNYSFNVTAVDGHGNTMTRHYTIKILEITTAALPDYTVGVPYSFQLLAAGGTGSYVWSITAGALPAGLTMSVSGLITGTPT